MSQPISQDTPKSDYTIPESEHTGAGAKSRGKDMADKARRTMENAKERTEESVDRAKRQAADTYYRAKAEASRAYEDGMMSVRTSFQERPLAYAFGAFAAGVLVGMLLPTSRPERRMFSSTAERMRERGNEMAARGKETISEAARAAERKIRGSEIESNEQV